MKTILNYAFGFLFAFGSGVFAQQYAAQVTVTAGNAFVVKHLTIKGDRLYPDSGDSSTSLAMVKAIEFRFIGVSLSMCDSMFRSGDRTSLEDILETNIGPVAQYSYLPTNLGDYLVWWLRAQYWNRDSAGAAKTIGFLRQTEVAEQVDTASLYFAMLLLDQEKIADAKKVFSSVKNPEAISVPMAEYLRGKIALEEGELRQAMQHVARVVAFHRLDPEWMAPATVLEARIYQRLGQPKKAATVADELIIAYPDSQWSTLGQQIKKETTGS